MKNCLIRFMAHIFIILGALTAVAIVGIPLMILGFELQKVGR